MVSTVGPREHDDLVVEDLVARYHRRDHGLAHACQHDDLIERRDCLTHFWPRSKVPPPVATRAPIRVSQPLGFYALLDDRKNVWVVGGSLKRPIAEVDHPTPGAVCGVAI